MGDLILATDREVQLVKKTVAQDLMPAELDLFVHMCRRWRLDPLRRQIYAQVYKRKKKNDDGNWGTVRSVVYVTGIDGYRTIADRTGNYRPGQRSVETSDAARDPAINPLGIVSATASVWKLSHGQWHEFSETVYWDEFAPIKDEWEDKRKTGKRILDASGQWGKMGRVMLQKCAESQALRRGWPDEYGGLYTSEEMDRSTVIDITPSEQLERADHEERQTKLGGPSVLIDWMDGKPLAAIAADKVHGAVMDFIKRNAKEPMTIMALADRNRAALRQFWGMKPDEALNLKKTIEATYQRNSVVT
jgi:phage recombination protein Bet